jgi:hypothetical protein
MSSVDTEAEAWNSIQRAEAGDWNRLRNNNFAGGKTDEIKFAL